MDKITEAAIALHVARCRIEKAIEARAYRLGYIKPHYPVPAKRTQVDYLRLMLGYGGMIRTIVNVPFQVSEWYE